MTIKHLHELGDVVFPSETKAGVILCCSLCGCIYEVCETVDLHEDTCVLLRAHVDFICSHPHRYFFRVGEL